MLWQVSTVLTRKWLFFARSSFSALNASLFSLYRALLYSILFQRAFEVYRENQCTLLRQNLSSENVETAILYDRALWRFRLSNSPRILYDKKLRTRNQKNFFLGVESLSVTIIFQREFTQNCKLANVNCSINMWAGWSTSMKINEVLDRYTKVLETYHRIIALVISAFERKFLACFDQCM